MKQWQMVGYYSDKDVEIIATPQAWLDLANALESEIRSRIELMPPKHQPVPYDGFLRTILIKRMAGPVTIDRHGEELIIAGDEASLGRLAWHFNWLATHPEPSGGFPQHYHIEYLPVGPAYLSPSALPLVATVTEII